MSYLYVFPLLLSCTLSLQLTTSHFQKIQSLVAIDKQGVLDTHHSCLKNDSSPRTLWENHVCSAIEAEVMPACMPQKRLPFNSSPDVNNTATVQGVIIQLHGYSACPDNAQHIMKRFQQVGYMTLAPLMVGHGRQRFHGCEKANALCVNGFPLTDMPKNRTVLEQYAKWVADMIVQELSFIPLANRSKGFKVSVIGHSIGGVIAQLVAESQNEKLKIDTVLMINPVFGPGIPALDHKIVDALSIPDDKQAHEKVREIVSDLVGLNKIPKNTTTMSNSSLWTKTFNYMLKKPIQAVSVKLMARQFYYHYHEVMSIFGKVQSLARFSKSITNHNFIMHESCEDEVRAGRGGYCAVKNINLLAASQAGGTAKSQVDLIPSHTKVKYISSKAEGIVRPKMIFDMASKLSKTRQQDKTASDVSMCIFDSLPNCTYFPGNNTCAMPHSCFSRSENLVHPPFKLYWENSLIQQIWSFIHGVPISASNNTDPRLMCRSLKLTGNWKDHRQYLGYPERKN